MTAGEHTPNRHRFFGLWQHEPDAKLRNLRRAALGFTTLGFFTPIAPWLVPAAVVGFLWFFAPLPLVGFWWAGVRVYNHTWLPSVTWIGLLALLGSFVNVAWTHPVTLLTVACNVIGCGSFILLSRRAPAIPDSVDSVF